MLFADQPVEASLGGQFDLWIFLFCQGRIDPAKQRAQHDYRDGKTLRHQLPPVNSPTVTPRNTRRGSIRIVAEIEKSRMRSVNSTRHLREKEELGLFRFVTGKGEMISSGGHLRGRRLEAIPDRLTETAMKTTIRGSHYSLSWL